MKGPSLQQTQLPGPTHCGGTQSVPHSTNGSQLKLGGINVRDKTMKPFEENWFFLLFNFGTSYYDL